MKAWRSKTFLIMLFFIAGMGCVIFRMSYNIQSQMEKAATENVREIVQIMENGISEIRKNDIASAENIAAGFSTDGDMEASLIRIQQESSFARLTFVPFDSSKEAVSSKTSFSADTFSAPENFTSDSQMVSDVYISDMGAWTYTIRKMVLEQGRPSGYLYADVIMERYDDILPSSIFQGDGLLYILDAKTLRFIYEPTSTNTFVSSKYDLKGFLNDFGIMSGQVEQSIGGAIEAHQSAIARMVIDGEKAYVYFWPIDEGTWYFCGIIPERSIQGESKAVLQTIFGVSLMVLLCSVLFFGVLYWYIRKNQKVRQYQNDLFHGIAKSIDDVVLLYDVKTGSMELSFDNIKRILGVEAAALEGTVNSQENKLTSINAHLFDLLSSKKAGSDGVLSEKTEWINPETGNRQFLEVETSHIVLDKAAKYIVSIRDITKDERMKESLRTSALAAQEASRIKSDFLSRMSHEIRTPMNAVTGMVQIAEARIDDKERVRDCLHKIEKSSIHLLGLINDILDISKIESQKMSLSENWFALDGLLDNIISIISVQAGLKEQTFEVNNLAGPVFLLTDQMRLSQILVNLLNNSVKYTQKGGSITLKVEKKSARVKGRCQMHFEIRDNGIGMSEEFQKKLFTPFEREDDQRVHAQTGTGLGMSIVMNMVSLMGGAIRVESTKGAGSTFYLDIAFPYKEAEQTESVIEAKDEEIDLTGMMILLAEDNEINREISTEFLCMANAQVECAEDGVEAFEKFRTSDENYYHLILMDMQMPHWDGLEATRQIRGLDRPDAKTIPIIAVTANAYAEDEQKCRKAGMNGHVAKPLDLREFYQKVREYLPEMKKEGKADEE